MRQDSIAFTTLNLASSKEPRFVIAIEFETASLYMTSHTGITGVPGVVIENVLRDPSATSQRIVPDEGRSEIGSFDFNLVDVDSAFTTEVRSRLAGGAGLRGKTVRYYFGHANAGDCVFSDLALFQTQVISEVSYDDGTYTVRCSDITREQRTELFEPKATTLRDSVTATDTTIPVYVTTGFELIDHDASYRDAPSASVGYIKLDKEVIRWTAKTADSFTDCTRGVGNTVAIAHSVDAGTVADRRPKVEEYIYLEGPVPRIAYSILTGVLYGTASVLPAHWQMGLDSALVRVSDFTGIGSDLWDTTEITAGFIATFIGLSKTDGKKFLEAELYQLIGCYSPIYSDGTIGLKRMNQVVVDSAAVVELNETNVISCSELTHDYGSLHNIIRIDWNWNLQEYTRRTIVADATSSAIHGEAPILQLKFKGLSGSRHTDAMIRTRISALRDRYTNPPETLEITVLPSLNGLEVGDIVRVKLANVRDFAGGTAAIQRAFEVQRKSQTDATGQVTLSLFGSTGLPSIESPTTDDVALPDEYYNSSGVDLSTVCTISVVGGVGVIQPGAYNLAGNDNLNASGAIYYYLGDLELASAATLTVNKNVQVRVRGFFQINGHVDGVGRGHAGIADDSSLTSTILGTPGFVGNSRGMDGLRYFKYSSNPIMLHTKSASLTEGAHASFPFLNLSVSGNALTGLPTDIQGTSGGPGGKVISQIPVATGDGGYTATDNATEGVGGTGAAAGSGFAVVCRGMAFGASALVNLSGANSVSTTLVDNARAPTGYPGPGGAGGPGSFLVLLDGSSVSVPDITGKFLGVTGHVPIDGHPLQDRFFGVFLGYDSITPPYSGYVDQALISDFDYSNACNRIQYVPGTQTAVEDQDSSPAPPTGLIVTPGVSVNTIRLTLGALLPEDVAEVYASIDNNRINSVLIAYGVVTEFTHELPPLTTRYYWARVRRNFTNHLPLYSPFFPVNPVAGVIGTTLPLGGDVVQVIGPTSWTPVTTEAGGAVMVATQTAIGKSGGIAAWDSQAYSVEKYLNGAYVTFRAAQTDKEFGIGLSSDPAADASYTSIDFFLDLTLSGFVQIFESGVLIGIFGTYTTTTFFQIDYDGSAVRYYKDGVLLRSITAVGRLLSLDSSFFSPGSSAFDVRFGPLAPTLSYSATLVARGQCVSSGNSIEKRGGVSAWDSDCYSSETYAAGCYLSFRSPAAGAIFMVGLNSDPTTDQNYTSIDYAWYITGGPNASFYESGANFGPVTAYDATTLFTITYDGVNVRYYANGALRRTVPRVGATFFLDTSFFKPGSQAVDVRFGPMASATSPQFNLVARGNCLANGRSIQKIGGTAGWDSDCYSTEGVQGACFVRFRAGQTDKFFMVGLNTDPATNLSYTSLDYAWYPYSDGTAHIYESGIHAGSFGSYATTTLFEVRHDGVGRITYLLDGVIARTLPAPVGVYYLDSSFNAPGALATDLEFGSLGEGASPDTSPVFLDTFEHQNVESRYRIFGYDVPVVTYPMNGANGGRVLQVAGSHYYFAGLDNIPFDPTVLYRLTARARQTTADSGDNDRIYIGVEGIAANGVTRINNGTGIDSDGSQYYVAAAGYDLGAAGIGTWVDFVGYFKGLAGVASGLAPSAYAPATLRTGVTYIRPIVYMNYTGGDGTQELDYLKIERLLVPDDADATVKNSRLNPDAEFLFPDTQNYWTVVPINGPSSGGIAFSATGGMVGGKASITWDNHAADWDLVPRAQNFKFQPVGEPWISVYLRLSRPATLGSDVLTLVATLQKYNDAGGTLNAGTYSWSLSNTTLPSASTWYEFTAFIKDFATSRSTYPFTRVILHAIGSTGISAGRVIDVDAFQATVRQEDLATGQIAIGATTEVATVYDAGPITVTNIA